LSDPTKGWYQGRGGYRVLRYVSTIWYMDWMFRRVCQDLSGWHKNGVGSVSGSDLNWLQGHSVILVLLEKDNGNNFHQKWFSQSLQLFQFLLDLPVEAPAHRCQIAPIFSEVSPREYPDRGIHFREHLYALSYLSLDNVASIIAYSMYTLSLPQSCHSSGSRLWCTLLGSSVRSSLPHISPYLFHLLPHPSEHLFAIGFADGAILEVDGLEQLTVCLCRTGRSCKGSGLHHGHLVSYFSLCFILCRLDTHLCKYPTLLCRCSTTCVTSTLKCVEIPPFCVTSTHIQNIPPCNPIAFMSIYRRQGWRGSESILFTLFTLHSS
jgi:hypothetical protein